MPVYRILIVDDSRFMRKVFSDMVNADEMFTVAATASDGEEAVRLALKLTPDIITMDLEMPRMNGLEALRRIMAVRPTPVIMLSAVTDNGTRDTIRALQFGAFDFVRKPDNAVNLDIAEVGEYLLEKLHIAAEAVRSGAFRMLPAVEETGDVPAPARTGTGKPVFAHTAPAASPENREDPPPLPVPSGNGMKSKAAPPVRPAQALPPAAPARIPPNKETADAGKRTAGVSGSAAQPVPVRQADQSRQPGGRKKAETAAGPPGRQDDKRNTAFSQIVAVGTSTGGPRALHEVLTKLPADFGAPVLVVQHMPPKFTHSLAQRLDSFCAIRVREASQDEVVETGTAYIAPGGKQMSLFKSPSGTYRIKLTEDGPRSGHMPSVDTLFESLVGHRELKRHTVLMTGMGSDGAWGMKALQEDGAETRIAEAEETCVVYGMPRSAVELGAVTHVLPLQQIASVLIREVKSRH